MFNKIYLFADNKNGFIEMPKWEDVHGNVIFVLDWKNKNENKEASQIIFSDNFGKNINSTGLLNNDETIKSLSFIDNIEKDIIIGHCFMEYCQGLEYVDMSGLKNLVKIGFFFLHNCEIMKKINLCGLNKLKFIDFCFLADCYNLQTIDMTDLISLKEIGMGSISTCINLVEINMSGLQNIKIGSKFCKDCYKLKMIDMSNMYNVKINDKFIWRYKTNINIKCSLATKKKILSNCNNDINEGMINFEITKILKYNNSFFGTNNNTFINL